MAQLEEKKVQFFTFGKNDKVLKIITGYPDKKSEKMARRARGMMGGSAMMGGRREKMPVAVIRHRRHRRNHKRLGGRVKRGRGWFKNAAKKVWGVGKKIFNYANSEQGRNLIKTGINAAKTIAATSICKI